MDFKVPPVTGIVFFTIEAESVLFSEVVGHDCGVGEFRGSSFGGFAVGKD
jgi:hypothetical protein